MNKIRLEHLLKEHHKGAFMWASQCCNYNREDGKEVLQITYLKILEKKAIYGGQSEFKTWLFSVIRFTAIDYLKRKGTSVEALGKLQMVEEEIPIEPDPINYRELLSRLPERQHQVLLLSFYHGMTLTTIADLMDLHIGTVRTHYERGKDSLKDIILKERHA